MRLKNSRGSITVYMCIIMSALILLGGVFGDLARLRSAKAVAKSISISVSRSVLGEYQELLYEAYGLRGLFIDENINDLSRDLIQLNIDSGDLIDPFKFKLEKTSIREYTYLDKEEEIKNQIVSFTVNDMVEDWIGSRLESFQILNILAENKSIMTGLMPSSDIDAADAYKQLEDAISQSSNLGKVVGELGSQLILNEYIVRIFSNSTGFENIVSIENAEVEKIITGANTEFEAKAKITAILSGIRFAVNMGYFLTNPILMEKAALYAVTVAGWSGVGVPIAQAGIIVAWCLAESALDVKLLFEGKSVPLVKNQHTWILSEAGLIDTATDLLMDMARETTEKAVDGAFDSLETMVSQAISEVRMNLEAELEGFIDKLLEPLEKKLNNFDKETKKELKSLLNNYVEKIQKRLDIKPKDNVIVELLKGYAKDWVRLTKSNISVKASEFLNKPKELLESFKREIRNTLSQPLRTFEEELIEKIKMAAEKGKEAVQKELSNLFYSKGSGELLSANISSSFINLQYKDYLRLFLLSVPEKQKLNRVCQIINTNMRVATNIESFSLDALAVGIDLDMVLSTPTFLLPIELIDKSYIKNNRFLIRERVVMGYEEGGIEAG